MKAFSTARPSPPALDGQVAWVVGGIGVIGSGLVRGLLRAGATVIVNSRFPSRLEQLNDDLGSPENLAVVTGTTLCLVAARFGLAPTGRNLAGVGLKMEENPADDQISGDPGGLTAADVLAYGSFGHAISIAMVLGLKAQGNFPPTSPFEVMFPFLGGGG